VSKRKKKTEKWIYTHFLLPAFLVFFSLNASAQGGVIPIQMNYAKSDSSILGTGSFSYKPFPLNSKTDSAALGMIAVVCDTFPDLISGNSYSRDFFDILRLDSLQIRIKHVNHSGQTDSLIWGVTGTYNGIFPQETASFGDTVLLNSALSTSGNPVLFSIPVGEYVSSSFSLLLHYKAPKEDTLWVWSGFRHDGFCAEIPGSERALNSTFYPNSFGLNKELGLVLPTPGGSDIFYNCDTLPAFDEAADGRSFIQNWDVRFFLTAVTTQIGQFETKEEPFLFPNPGHDIFRLSEPVSRIRIFSPSGVLVWQINEPTNQFQPHLSPGFYWTELTCKEQKKLIKLIITNP
jgi:hypothetical protein